MKKAHIKELFTNAKSCSKCGETFGLLQVKVLIQKSKLVVCESCGVR